MPIPSDPPRPFAPLLRLERARLLELLVGLEPADWQRQTPCPAWDVLGLCVHLIGDDFSFLAMQRDGHFGTAPPAGVDETGFVRWLDDLQIEWVHAARRLSPRLAVDLLGWTGEQVAATVEEQDPTARTALVTWASAQPVPVWLDHGRELTERWIHRQQLLDALGRPSDLRTDLLDVVLDTLRWAYPHRLAPVSRPVGTQVVVEVGARRWMLTAEIDGWSFTATVSDALVGARAVLSEDDSWRLLTNNLEPVARARLELRGDEELLDVVLRTRAIIGEPDDGRGAP